MASASGRKEKLLLGRFEVGKLLGQGTFAKVYVARNVASGESVAIKVIEKEKILRGGLMGHIKREIAILRRVRHPNIVQLLEVMASKTKIYFVMELVRGGELFNKVAKGRLKESLARSYFQQLASAVSFCHARGVFHRDLKPENLLLDHEGSLKVSDFGLSAVSDQVRRDGLFHTFCGTPAYVAPEVLARRGYDAAKADIWSCGVVLFVLMAGYLPFHDHNLMAMYKKIHRGEFRCPNWFSPGLVRLLRRLLDTNPATRITLPDLMAHPWFLKGFHAILDSPAEQEQVMAAAEVEETALSDSEAAQQRSRKKPLCLPRPASLNAFDIISFSRGFDLSGLFEEGANEARFVTGAPVADIMARVEEVGRLVSLSVRKKDCRVSLEGSVEGEKGPLTIAAEIFELTPSLSVLEVKHKAGHSHEFNHFCNHQLRPLIDTLTPPPPLPTSDPS